MNRTIAFCLLVLSGLIAAISQLMLKKSAAIHYPRWWMEYLNILVISSYALLLLTSLVNMQAMVYLPYKVVPVVGTVSYIFVIMIGKFQFKEYIGTKKWIGLCLIIFGILIFNA